MTRLFALLLLAGVCLPAQAQAPPPAPVPEVERLDSLIEELTSLKTQISQTETRIDSLLRALSEQRGALKTKPTYNALKVTPEDNGPVEARKPLVRCRALTSSGSRCTRPALEGQKYCRQHALAHQK